MPNDSTLQKREISSLIYDFDIHKSTMNLKSLPPFYKQIHWPPNQMPTLLLQDLQNHVYFLLSQTYDIGLLPPKCSSVWLEIICKVKIDQVGMMRNCMKLHDWKRKQFLILQMLKMEETHLLSLNMYFINSSHIRNFTKTLYLKFVWAMILIVFSNLWSRSSEVV